MADVLGLESGVDRRQIFDLSRGHPLVARYLIEALKEADQTRRERLLAGEFQFDGDIEVVYAAAWREIQDDEDAREVMAYLAHAEGLIEPALLTQAVSEQAVERAFGVTRHLLNVTSRGWSLFHNSFRLYVLSKPRLRLGNVDPDYSSNVYRQLAKLARMAGEASPQRWLELRYFAHAQESELIIELAQPGRFRQQFRSGRAASEILADIRLSFVAAKTLVDSTVVFRLLLARDEIERRAGVLGTAPSVVDALIALGDIDDALAFAESNSVGGYKVIDALLDSGDIDRARSLFDRIDPVSRMMGEDSYDMYDRREEVADWAACVFHFRDAGQILEAIDQIANSRLIDRGPTENETKESNRRALKVAVARAAVTSRPKSDLGKVVEDLGVDPVYLPYLQFEAAMALREQGAVEDSLGLLSQATSNPDFLRISSATRRLAALVAVELGETSMARTIFLGLKAPAIAKMDDRIESDVPGDVTQAVISHSELATIVGEPIVEVSPSKKGVLQPLQYHARTVGMMLGRIRAGVSTGSGEVARLAKRTLTYLENVSPTNSGEFYTLRQVEMAAPVLLRALLRAGALSGEREFGLVVAQFDYAFELTGSKNGSRHSVRRNLAMQIYRWDRNGVAAGRRLEPLVIALRESTPDQQVAELAELAASFALIDNRPRARELVRHLYDESLGYALAPKKDPQYALWRDLFVRASAADPERRPERLALMMRQLRGMTETEGQSAAYRVAGTILAEAAIVNSANGLGVARELSDLGLLSWDGIVNDLLHRVIRRQPELVPACIVTWASLAVPYARRSHYRSERFGDFISTSIANLRDGEWTGLIDHLRAAIEAESEPALRGELLKCLHEAASRRGASSKRLTDAVSRWQSDATPERERSTPDKYDDVNTLEELERRASHDGEERFGFSGAFVRLISSANIEQSRNIFERHESLQRDYRARFALAKMALEGGDEKLGRRLVDEYSPAMDSRATWSSWSGSGKLKYFQMRVILDGAAACKDAYADLVGELSAGREYTMALLSDMEDIFQTIAPSPNWPAMWTCLAEQLRTTREYAIGSDYRCPDNQGDDKNLIVALYQWAFSLSQFELLRQFRTGARALASVEGGDHVFASLVQQLVAGGDDGPAQALQLLVSDGFPSAKSSLSDVVRSLLSHSDYAVAVVAGRIAERWGATTNLAARELPVFYSIQMPDEDVEFARPRLIDQRSGAMLVEDPLGWTFMFEGLVKALVREHVSITQIRRRCKMFIDDWGGLAVFGQKATQRLEEQLSGLSMRLTYARPHMTVAARALRHVAGELRQGGLLEKRDEPFLLEMMGFPAARPQALMPAERPRYLPRPSLDEVGWGREDEQQWAGRVTDDARKMEPRADIVIAEITRFRRRHIRRKLTAERLRVPFLKTSGEDFEVWRMSIPRAIWLEEIVPLIDEPAETIVRRFQESEVPDIPRDMLVICPVWLRILNWRSDPTNWLSYRDTSGRVVARIIWWRDGGPSDIQEDESWGEGVLVTVTAEGWAQLEVKRGALDIRVQARRTVAGEEGNGDADVRIATANECAG
jgi:hypothetical protein